MRKEQRASMSSRNRYTYLWRKKYWRKKTTGQTCSSG